MIAIIALIKIMNQQHPRMQSLRDQIHEIMMENMTPLQEKLRSQSLSNCSVEQLFQTLAQQYRQKQSQVTTMGKLVLYTIDLLTEQINEKNQLSKDYQATIYDYKIEQQDSNIHIEQCQAALQDYKERVEELEVELTEMRELRERYQTMYEQEINSKSSIDTFDNSKQGESLEIDRGERLEEERHKMEVSLLDYQIKQLKLEIGRKDALILQKQQQRVHFNDRFKAEVTKNQTLQGNFKVLQQNFRSAVIENDNLKRIVDELEEKQVFHLYEKEKDRERSRGNTEDLGVDFKQKRVDSSDKHKQKSHAEKQFPMLKDSRSQSSIRRSVSQSAVRKVSVQQPKNTLAFDLQSLQSGTSMISPLASEIGKPNPQPFLHVNSRFLKPRTPKSSRVINHNRHLSRSASEISVSPARRMVTPKKRIPAKPAVQSSRLSFYEKILKIFVSDRIRKN